MSEELLRHDDIFGLVVESCRHSHSKVVALNVEVVLPEELADTLAPLVCWVPSITWLEHYVLGGRSDVFLISFDCSKCLAVDDDGACTRLFWNEFEVAETLSVSDKIRYRTEGQAHCVLYSECT